MTSNPNYTAIAVFRDHDDVDRAIGKLIDAGCNMENFSLIGKGYQTEEKIVGFYTTGDRMKFWGKAGAFWGGLWGLFLGGVVVTLPPAGPMIVLGKLAAMVVSSIEGAIAVGGLSTLGAAIYSLGIPKNSVVHYESALKSDGFLLLAQGSVEEMLKATTVMENTRTTVLDLYKPFGAPSVDRGNFYPA
jgi:hypothetical protein